MTKGRENNMMFGVSLLHVTLFKDLTISYLLVLIGTVSVIH